MKNKLKFNTRILWILAGFLINAVLVTIAFEGIGFRSNNLYTLLTELKKSGLTSTASWIQAIYTLGMMGFCIAWILMLYPLIGVFFNKSTAIRYIWIPIFLLLAFSFIVEIISIAIFMNHWGFDYYYKISKLGPAGQLILIILGFLIASLSMFYTYRYNSQTHKFIFVKVNRRQTKGK